MNAGSTINVNAEDDVKLTSSEDMELGTVSGANVDIAATGNLTGTDDVPNVAGSSVELGAHALNDEEEANIGSADHPMTTEADELSATGTNVYIINNGNLTLNDFQADGDVEISTDGNLNQNEGTTVEGSDVTLDATGDVEIGGTDTDNLNVNAGGSVTQQDGTAINTGNLNVDAGEDVPLEDITADNVNVTAGGDANLNNTEAGGNVNVDAGNDATLDNTNAGNNVSVDAGNDANLGSVTADSLDATAGGDVTVGDTTVQEGNLNAGGDINQASGTVLDASNLTMEAGGDIGSEKTPVVIDTEVITATATNIYLVNLSDHLTVENITAEDVQIQTNGSINTTREGLIKAINLDINAFGNIGDPKAPLFIYVNGKLQLVSRYGGVWYTNFYSPYWGQKLSHSGVFRAEPELLTTTQFALVLFPDLAENILKDGLNEENSNFIGGCPTEVLQKLISSVNSEVDRLLWKLIDDNATMYDFVLYLKEESIPTWADRILLEIALKRLDPAYEDELEGETVYVLLAVKGQLVWAHVKVENGMIRLSVNDLGMDIKPEYTQVVIVSEEIFQQLYTDGQIPGEDLTNAEEDSMGSDSQKADLPGNKSILF